MRTPPAYRVRPARTDDAGFLADVVLSATRAQGRLPDDLDEAEWRAGFAEWTSEQIGADIPGSTTSVIESDGGRAGRLRVARGDGRIELCGIQLLPRVQSRGLGTAIIEQLKAEAAAAGVPLDLGVEKDNPDARRFYDRLGFVLVGEDEEEHKLRWSPEPGARSAASRPGRPRSRADAGRSRSARARLPAPGPRRG